MQRIRQQKRGAYPSTLPAFGQSPDVYALSVSSQTLVKTQHCLLSPLRQRTVTGRKLSGCSCLRDAATMSTCCHCPCPVDMPRAFHFTDPSFSPTRSRKRVRSSVKKGHCQRRNAPGESALLFELPGDRQGNLGALFAGAAMGSNDATVSQPLLGLGHLLIAVLGCLAQSRLSPFADVWLVDHHPTPPRQAIGNDRRHHPSDSVIRFST